VGSGGLSAPGTGLSPPGKNFSADILIQFSGHINEALKGSIRRYRLISRYLNLAVSNGLQFLNCMLLDVKFISEYYLNHDKFQNNDCVTSSSKKKNC